MKRNEHSLRDLWDNIKCKNMQIIEVPEEEKKQKVSEKICVYIHISFILEYLLDNLEK